jgi:hypothetical protein
VASNVPVVLVVLDELPVSSLLTADGAIDGVRYPAFARLAREGTWYPRATTVHDHTPRAVPAILSGLLPSKPDFDERVRDENLFTLLGGQYSFHVRELATRLCPPRYCRPDTGTTRRAGQTIRDAVVARLHTVLPQRWRQRLPAIEEWWRWMDRGAPHEEFEKFAAGIRPKDNLRTLTFLHLLLPHHPWQYLPSGRQYGNGIRLDGAGEWWAEWNADAWLVEQGLQRHLLQAGYADRLLGRLLDRLEAAGAYDDALVIITADHGISFATHGSRRHVTIRNVADIAAVPLFVKLPGQHRGRVDRRDARTIDIVRTIADVLGIELSWKADGQSLLGSARRRDVVVVADAGGTVTATSNKVAAGVAQTARRNAALFGEGHDSMFVLGDRTELLGLSVDVLESTSSNDSEVFFEEGDRFQRYVKSSRFVPAHIGGQIVRRAHAKNELAISVNGRIRALTRSFPLYGQERFTALVPESSFVSGKNVVDVYDVEVVAGRVRLVRLGGSRPAAESEPLAVRRRDREADSPWVTASDCRCNTWRPDRSTNLTAQSEGDT